MDVNRGHCLRRGESRHSRTCDWGGCSGSQRTSGATILCTNRKKQWPNVMKHGRHTRMTPGTLTCKSSEVSWSGLAMWPGMTSCRILSSKVPWRVVDAAVAYERQRTGRFVEDLLTIAKNRYDWCHYQNRYATGLVNCRIYVLPHNDRYQSRDQWLESKFSNCNLSFY